MTPFEPVLLIVAVNCAPDTVTVPVKNWSKLEQLPELFVRHVNPMVDADAEGAATNMQKNRNKTCTQLIQTHTVLQFLRFTSSKTKPQAIRLSKSYTAQNDAKLH